MSKHGYGAMRVDPVSGAVLGGPLEPVYVYEAPVRIWHWVMMIAMFVLVADRLPDRLAAAGDRRGGDVHLLLRLHPHDPLHRGDGLRGGVRGARLLGVRRQPLMRARSSFRRCGACSWWKGLFGQTMYYLFLKQGVRARGSGHNPLAQFAMFVDVHARARSSSSSPGFALYAEQCGWGSTLDERCSAG